MLELELKNQLAGYLQRVQQPFEMVASLDASETSKQMRDLLDTIQSLHNMIVGLGGFCGADYLPHDPMGFAEQTDRIFDVQNVEQHDEGR